jgi:hypothetical protein
MIAIFRIHEGFKLEEISSRQQIVENGSNLTMGFTEIFTEDLTEKEK